MTQHHPQPWAHAGSVPWEVQEPHPSPITPFLSHHPMSAPWSSSQGVSAKADAMPSSAPGRDWEGFGVPCGPLQLGLPLQLSFCRETQKGVGKEGGKGT